MPERRTRKGSPAIALLTDFGWSSWYIGVMKGVICAINPSARIIDLSHNVSSQDVREGSFILGNSFNYFPKGTVFLCVVDPGVGGKRKNLVVETDSHYFVAPDNGILSSIFEKGPARGVFEVAPGKYTLDLHGSTFWGRDVFAPIAAHLSNGITPGTMGREVKSVLTVPAMEPYLNKEKDVSGRAVYVDAFGNIITNISEDFLASVFDGEFKPEQLRIRLAGKRINGVYRYYEQGEGDALMALFNSWGYLEIAVNRGNAFQTLGLTEKRSLEIIVSGGRIAKKPRER